MNKSNIEALKTIEITLDKKKSELFDIYMRIFLQKNLHVNLISKNDEKFLFEKHIFDSLAINKFLKPYLEMQSKSGLNQKSRVGLPTHQHEAGNALIAPQDKQVQTLLDIGTGGGFPSIPLAIIYGDTDLQSDLNLQSRLGIPAQQHKMENHYNLEIYAVDSIRKKIKAIEEIKDELKLKNLHPICERAENLDQQFDYVTTRAVSTLDNVLKYAVPRLKKGGYFIAYKSKKALKELDEAKKTIKKSGIKLVDIIEYTLPLEEVFERNLVIFKK